MLEAIEGLLDADELAVVRRARNAKPSGSARAQRNIKDYRAASALEALVAHWAMDSSTWPRFEAVVGPRLEDRIDAAFDSRLDAAPDSR
jgi:ribonuclease-3 family protein